MTREEIANWAVAYIDAPIEIGHGHPLWWAVDKFSMPLDDKTSPEDAWEAILEIISRKPPPRVLGVLAAGPLENLIHAHGTCLIDRIEMEAKINPAFRYVLGGIYKSGSEDVWNRVLQVLASPAGT